MAHYEPVTFREPSKELMHHSDERDYDSITQQDVCREIRAIFRARETIRRLQQECNHLRKVINLPARREFQCQDCGVTRLKPFGMYCR